MLNNKMIFGLLMLIGGSIMTLSFKGHHSQEQQKNKYLTMKVVESGGVNVLWDNKIIVAYDDGKIDEIPLEKSKPGNFAANLKKVNDEINNLSNKGYELIEMSGSDQLMTTYVFKRTN
jgi:hypothetical protein